MVAINPWPSRAEIVAEQLAEIDAEVVLPKYRAVRKLVGMLKIVRGEAARHVAGYDYFADLDAGIADEMSNLIGAFCFEATDENVTPAQVEEWRADLTEFGREKPASAIDSLKE